MLLKFKSASRAHVSFKRSILFFYGDASNWLSNENDSINIFNDSFGIFRLWWFKRLCGLHVSLGSTCLLGCLFTTLWQKTWWIKKVMLVKKMHSSVFIPFNRRTSTYYWLIQSKWILGNQQISSKSPILKFYSIFQKKQMFTPKMASIGVRMSEKWQLEQKI